MAKLFQFTKSHYAQQKIKPLYKLIDDKNTVDMISEWVKIYVSKFDEMLLTFDLPQRLTIWPPIQCIHYKVFDEINIHETYPDLFDKIQDSTDQDIRSIILSESYMLTSQYNKIIEIFEEQWELLQEFIINGKISYPIKKNKKFVLNRLIKNKHLNLYYITPPNSNDTTFLMYF